MILCLSCVVIFCTVYALILPAITLERKAVCGQEEHSHTEECYSSDGQLTCGKTEHTHTESCYADDKTSEKPSGDDSGEDAGVIPNASKNEVNRSAEEGNAQGTSEASAVTVTSENAAVSGEAQTTEGAETPETPETPVVTGEYVLNDHLEQIESVKFTYKKAGQDTVVPDNGTIETPDDLNMNIEVAFTSIPVATLKEYNGKFVYNLPNEFQIKETTTKNMTQDSNVIGTITVETSGKVVVSYNTEYLNKLEGNSTISGNFFASAEFKLSAVTEATGQATIKTPKGDTTINLGTDYNEHYGTVTVNKQCSKEDKSGDYIKYTVTVTAGEDGIKNLYVVDQFTENKNLVNYVGIEKNITTLKSTENQQNPYETITSSVSSPTAGTIYLTNEADATTGQKIPDRITDATAVTEPGSFVWNIAEMKAGEIRTLTYFVKLKDTGGIINVENNQNIKNKVQLYTKSANNKIYTKGDSESNFSPNIDYTMQKDAATPQKDTEGNYIIDYTLSFRLNEASNYPLKNFVFWDYLNYPGYTTHGDMYPYISYIRDSFKVMNSTNQDITAKMDISWAKATDADYKKDWDYTSDGNPVRFKIMGKNGNPININPGETYSVTYQLKVQPEVYAVMKANSVEIKNKYLASCSNACKSDGFIGNTGHTVTLNEYQWVQKTKDPADAEEVIQIPSNQEKYQYTSTGISKMTQDSSGNSESFTVPAGSWKYTVNVNKTLGQWDLTDTTMTDTLSPNYMQYVGYAKITAYNENDVLVGTKWLKIDGKSSFTLKPSQIEWTENTYWYKFEYYAKPNDLTGISKENVTNTFKLDKARRNGNDFSFGDAVKSSQTVTLTGSYHLNAQKKAWYYEKPEENATTWQNGQLYWIIEVKGNVIKAGTQIKDAIYGDSNVTDSFMHRDGTSIAGIYKGNLGEIENSYKNLTEFESKNQSSNVQNIAEKFTLTYNTTKQGWKEDQCNDMFIKANEDIELGENQNLYIIVRTEPMSLPDTYRVPKTYRNRLFIIDSGKTENQQREMGSAEQKLYYGGDILKELGQVFTYDGSQVTTTTPGQDGNDPSKIVGNLLEKTGSGIYASWAFKVNHAGELKGDYRVLEEIPEGMELVYIRIKWLGQVANTQATKVVSKEIDEIGTEWEKIVNTSTSDNNQSQETIYYVRNDKKQALIKLGEFVDKKIDDQCSVDVQVVCRVTDKDVLLGGKQKTFTNKVTLQNADGTKNISTATATATLSDNNLTKKNNLTDKSNYTMLKPSTSQRLTYTITANARGQQLLTGDGEKLTIVDKLGDNLSLVGDSFKAKNLKDNSVVNITPKYDPKTKIIEIEIPDKTPVEITYSATVNVAPDTDKTVNVTNEVYWKSYASGGGATNTINNYSYTLNAGGSTESTEHPTLTINKIDQDDMSNKMQGVNFNIYECELVGEEIQRKSESEVESGTTNEAGEYVVEATKLNYNTIYEVRETSTIGGYILDKTPHYIMYVKKEKSGEFSVEAKNYIAYCEKKKDPNQYKVEYNLQSSNLDIYNAQKGIIVQKAFINDAAGKYHNPVSGTYWFGLYDNEGGTGDPLETVSIEYSPNDTEVKTAKFKNQNINQTYYVFELDNKGQPIKASQEATINNQQYIVTYSKNAATCGDTVTVTNQSHTKMLPATGSCGTFLYRLAGTILIFFAGLLMLIRYRKK